MNRKRLKLEGAKGIATLGAVFVLVLVLIILGFSLSAASVTHLHLNTHNLRETEAKQLARSAVAAAVQEIFDLQTYGKDRTTDTDITVRLDGTHPDAGAFLTFNEAQARDNGLPFSTNNLDSNSAVLGDGRSVAGQAVHLVGVGQSGGVRRQVEAVLRFTLFPQAIASSGPILSTGPLLIGTLADPATPSEVNLLPADIMSNAEANPGISLVAGTKVTGDVQTVGTVALAAGSIDVWGEVRDNAAAEDIVTLDPLQYDPVVLGLTPENLTEPSYPGPMDVSGALRAGDAITVTGDLVFDGGLLFVAGDLVVTGKMTGTGILATTGDVTVGQGADFTSGQKIAVLCKGRLSLTGTGPQTNFFQGLVYTQRGLSANQITVVGAVVNDAGPTDGVQLNQCRVFYDPTFPELTIETITLPEVIADLPVTDHGYVVAINSTEEPPRLEYFRYDGESEFGPGKDPDEARRAFAQRIQGLTPDATFEIPQSLLDLTDGDGPGEMPAGGFMPGGAIMPGRGVVVEATAALAGIEQLHTDLIAPYASELSSDHAATMTGMVIRGFDRRDTSWMEGTGEETKVGITPSEVLKPNEHQRVVLWKEG
jgi:hypothetical protein